MPESPFESDDVKFRQVGKDDGTEPLGQLRCADEIGELVRRRLSSGEPDEARPCR